MYCDSYVLVIKKKRLRWVQSIATRSIPKYDLRLGVLTSWAYTRYQSNPAHYDFRDTAIDRGITQHHYYAVVCVYRESNAL